jgi:hypothetical protein
MVGSSTHNTRVSNVPKRNVLLAINKMITERESISYLQREIVKPFEIAICDFVHCIRFFTILERGE